MSSLNATIQLISKVSGDQLYKVLVSIDETLSSEENISPKDIKPLCHDILPLLSRTLPSTSTRTTISIIKHILEKQYPDDFPKKLLQSLTNPLGNNKRMTREEALLLADSLVPILTPTVFWDSMKEHLSSKNQYLKESALILFHSTITNFPDFKTNKYLDDIFAIMNQNAKIPRTHAFTILKVIYEKNPTFIEKKLRSDFGNGANDVISRLKGEQAAKKSGTLTQSYADAIDAPQINSNDEIEELLIKEFNEPLPDFSPITSPCPFDKLSQMLKRSADWQDRMEGLKILVSHARGTSKPEEFVKNLRLINDSYSDCLIDARSALFKQTCLSLVALAKQFGNLMDQHSEWLISSVITKAIHGTFVIAKSAELAITNFVGYVQGKNIKKTLIELSEHSGDEVRIVVAKSMIIAKKKWTQGLSKNFDAILIEMKKDSSPHVRQLVSNLDISGIPVPTNIKERSQTKEKTKSLEKPKKFNDEESKIVNHGVSNKDFQDLILDNDDNDEPLKNNQNDHNANSNNNGNYINNDDNINNELIQDDNHLQENELDNADEIFQKFYEERNTKGLAEFIENVKPLMYGHMQDAVDLIVMDLNEEDGIDSAVSLLQILCNNYRNSLMPYISQILLDLPEDEEYGMKCLNIIASSIGELPLARLLKYSKLSYINGFLLKVAAKVPDDIEFQTYAVLNTIANRQYEQYHFEVFSLIKKIYELNPIKCEALFSSMPQNDREEILDEIHDQIPTIYQIFNSEKRDDLPARLVNEINKAKNGEPIDFETLLEVPPTDSSLLLLSIAAIRESHRFDPRFVDYLIPLTESKESAIVGAVTNALNQRCETDPNCCLLIANSFVPTAAAYKSFARSICYSDRTEAVEAMMRIKDRIIEGLGNINTKYAALLIIANACVHLGDEYKNFCGQLSPPNQKLLESLIAKNNVTK
ncbi:hypothetical protein TRFO_07763 [Tritrichomonas foetus]|uniref:Uncharacterized protein n=1 Tax=Tritrichomonas foetus TaxID=1144522 RepID=A0A1J4JQV1_9EUKA|nr:hypothetical protein TRFO_07763 [Tritrichomonas foetus]|eukprot:OHT00784.1 hypothetical protein TRFO_07763 [Tritrichomonas foetus]